MHHDICSVAGANTPRFSALHVEWCKAYSCSRRLNEEVCLLQEEMRRTIAYGATAAEKWDSLASAILPNSDPELTEGRRAYAGEKVDREHDMCRKLQRDWASILVKANV
jgi:hypothetical protein